MGEENNPCHPAMISHIVNGKCYVTYIDLSNVLGPTKKVDDGILELGHLRGI